MSDFYKKAIIGMIREMNNAEWLRMIYSFIKVFADDKEGVK